MGMYTGLRGKVFLKDEYINKIEEQLNYCEGFYWELILPEENKYNNYSRNSFIPNGMVCYMPPDWDDKEVTLSGNVLEFCCSLKDY